MLYDNALLARAYAIAFTVTGRERYATVARGVLAYLDREMALEGGGIASAQDADTDGHEGLTFVWTPAEVRAVLARRRAGGRRLRLVRHHRHGQLRGLERAVGGRRRVNRRPGSRRRGGRCSPPERRGPSRPATTRRSRPGTGWHSPPTPTPAGCSACPPTSSAPARSRRSCSARCRRTGGCCARGATAARRSPRFSEDYGAVADGLLALHRATGELRLAGRGAPPGAARRRPVRRHRRGVPADGPRRRAPRRPPARRRRQPGAERQLAAGRRAAAAGARCTASTPGRNARGAALADRGGGGRPRAAGVRARAGSRSRVATATPREIAIVGDAGDAAHGRAAGGARRPLRAARGGRRSPSRPTRCSRRCRCSPGGRRSTARPPRTSASGSPAAVP